jgi:hypothetical protein
LKRKALLVAAIAALVFAGAASAYAVAKTVTLAPGHCKTIHHTKVCAGKAKSKTVTRNVTSTVTKTVTVSPSPIGKTVSGGGDETLAPITIPANGDTVTWTSQPFNDGVGDTYNVFGVSCGDQDFDNGGSLDGTTSGSSFLPGGTYTCQVNADDGGWTISF